MSSNNQESAASRAMGNYANRPMADKTDYAFVQVIREMSGKLIKQISARDADQATDFFTGVAARVEWAQGRLECFEGAFKSHDLDGYNLVRLMQAIKPAIVALLSSPDELEEAAQKLVDSMKSDETASLERKLKFFEDAFGFSRTVDEQELEIVAQQAGHFYKLHRALRREEPVEVLVGPQVETVINERREPEMFLLQGQKGASYVGRFINFDWIEWFLAQSGRNTPDMASLHALRILREQLYPEGLPEGVEMRVDNQQRNPEIIIERITRL